MANETNVIANTCSFAGVRPIMVDLPYPEIQVREKNLIYANLLSADYCGSVSEMSAITQYINNENRMSCEKCPLAKTIIGIAMAEMIHLQKLGELIFLLGGSVSFTAVYPNGRKKQWTPEYLSIPENVKHMILADIEAEKAAINQYNMHIKMINDDYINAVLLRIIKDEEYHIMILQTLLQEMP
ncbi:MAG: rubrerythrin family protein [Lachnospiraceae bacterium]|nr:rubrerythrin family protein [Lachnospiraceae bacterium]